MNHRNVHELSETVISYAILVHKSTLYRSKIHRCQSHRLNLNEENQRGRQRTEKEIWKTRVKVSEISHVLKNVNKEALVSSLAFDVFS